MNKKLNAKDFILIGVLTALMWIICMIISTVMSIAGPVTNVFYPAVVAIPNGIVMMLLLAKVPKKGVFTICGTIQGILFLLVGGWNFLKSCRRGFIRWREMPGKCFLAVNDSVFLWREPF